MKDAKLTPSPVDERARSASREALRIVESVYGPDFPLLSSKAEKLEALLRAHRVRFGERSQALLVRAPARVNLMGVHIEHRGGEVNYYTVHRDIWVAASPRPDTRLRFENLDPAYPPFEVDLEETQHLLGLEWLDLLEQVQLVPGHWRNYVEGVAVYLSRLFGQPLRGLDATVWGDIPPAAGLSSSSALVVAAGEALLAANELQLDPAEKPVHYGTAEWYVGTRGGAGDHAAMVLGRLNQVLHIRFFPILYRHIAFPEGYRLVAINSLHPAAKSDGVRNVFNEKIVAYEIGLRLIRKRHPEFADRLQHLRDVNAENLGISQADVYRILRELPMTISRAEALRILGDDGKDLERLFRTHPEPLGGYEVRGVCMFGLAECDRGRLTADLLKRGEMEQLGRLMYISHDGDRVSRRNAAGYRPWSAPVDDDEIDRLIELSESANPLDREAARLAYQPGAYRCSVLELDEIVDLARKVDGVLGAGLTGAGLGGMVLALVRAEAADRLLEELKVHYYEPRGFPLAAEVCYPSAGAGIVAQLP